MILTKRPVSTPEPTPPRWASKAPTATGIPGRRPSFLAQSFGQAAGGDIGRVGLGVEAVAELAQARVELGQERLGRESAPAVVEHGLVAGGAAAPLHLQRIVDPGEKAGDVVGALDPGVGGGGDLRVRPQAVEDLAPEPLGGIGPAALGEVFGVLGRGEGGDLGGFGVAGVVLPEPGVGVRVLLELLVEGERLAGAVDGERGRAGRVDADADDGGGIEGLDLLLALRPGPRARPSRCRGSSRPGSGGPGSYLWDRGGCRPGRSGRRRWPCRPRRPLPTSTTRARTELVPKSRPRAYLRLVMSSLYSGREQGQHLSEAFGRGGRSGRRTSGTCPHT